MMFNRNEKKLGVQTPTYSRFSMTPNPNLGWQPTESSGTKPPKPPTSGSNAVKQPNVGSSVQRSKQFCPYETPCGWCTKWDKKCDKKIGTELGQRVNINPVDDAIDEPIGTLLNKACTSESDHEWECNGISTGGSSYRCKKCYAHKFVPYTTELHTSPTITTYYDGLSVTFPVKDPDHMWNNNNEYDYKKENEK